MKVAIVHDWFAGGGAERVVWELHNLFPEAPIYTSYCSPEWREKLGGVVKTGYLQHWPFPRLRKFLPLLRIWWFSQLDLEAYDLVISSSGAEAKGVKTRPGTVHINYCHAPTHYYWSRYSHYMHQPGFGWLDPLARLGLHLLVGPLRKWDYKAAQRPDHLIANSSFTKAQIKKYYGRDAEVIHPPVETERFRSSQTAARSGFVTAGRQTPYKRIDLAVQACSQLGLELTVVGDGPDNKRLRKMAGPTIKFAGRPSDTEIGSYFATASAFLFPATDDFGIVAVEAMAAGTPVIAYKDGGALDYIKPGKTGEFFKPQTAKALEEVLRSFQSGRYDNREIANFADTFSPAVFRQKFSKYLENLGF